jgi:hypothetical protein
MSRRRASYSASKTLSDKKAARLADSVNRLADVRAAANLVKDLRAPFFPARIAEHEVKQSRRLALAVSRGRMTLAEARALLRGAA